MCCGGVPSSSGRPATTRGWQHVVAFARGEGTVTVVPRLAIGLGGDWGDTVLELPAGRWRNELRGDLVDGGPVGVGARLRRFPVGLLSRAEAA
jgi:(1->4)-alpha-D-glucan 1-alpha-D-glucosylmutase